jgi:hypothetical protein
MTQKSIMDHPELASFTCSAEGLTIHDARNGPPPSGEHTLAVVNIVDTVTDRGQQVIRRMIGPSAEEVLATYPGRFVIYSLQREGAWVRACPDEGLVIHELMKIVRQPPQAPATVDVLLFLEAAFHRRLIKMVADEALARSDIGGNA